MTDDKTGHKIKKRLTRPDVLTIPNLLSLFRLALIPWIVRAYCVHQSAVRTVALVALSGATDVADGWIARRFGMVSDLGKVLDPVADKATQASLVLCLIERTRWMALLLALLLLREATLAAWGLIALRRTDTVHCSKWHGKLCTGVIYLCMSALILFPSLPDAAAQAMALLCAAMVAFTGLMYSLFYAHLLHGKKGSELSCNREAAGV